MLVVQAAIMGRGGEIFILRMGEPIKIIELAKDLIALHGLRPEIDVPIKLIGLRPGEKLHEALVVDGEQVADSQHSHILATRAVVPDGLDIGHTLQRLQELVAAATARASKRF